MSQRVLEPASEEECLTLKTRQGLSKRKYQAFERFCRRKFGTKILHSWDKIMQCRNDIIPEITPPFWDEGFLTVHVTLRNMLSKNIARLLEIPKVRSTVCSTISNADNGVVSCVLHITSGSDSATGFPHYNQEGILHNDDSLMSEHVMCLQLDVGGQEVWINPNPQSDTFCQARSMRWAKETDALTKRLFDSFYEEVKEINENPLVITLEAGELRVGVKAIYTLIDGKSANAIVGNRNTHACPLHTAPNDDRIGGSFFHSQLNAVEWLFRVAGQKHVEGHPAQANPAVRAKSREMADDAEDEFHISINHPKIGGGGTCNTGKTGRDLLANPEKFAEILGVNPSPIQKLRLISSLALSRHKLDATKVKHLYDELESELEEEFPFVKRLPPCIHKYSHLPEFISRSVCFYI